MLAKGFWTVLAVVGLGFKIKVVQGQFNQIRRTPFHALVVSVFSSLSILLIETNYFHMFVGRKSFFEWTEPLHVFIFSPKPTWL